MIKFYDYNNDLSCRQEAEKGKEYDHRFSIENLMDFKTKWQGTSAKPVKIIDGNSFEVEMPENADVMALVDRKSVV